MRCRTLAAAIRSRAGYHTTMVVGGHGPTVARVTEHDVHGVPAQDDDLTQMRELSPDLVVSDINYLSPARMTALRTLGPVANLAPRGLPKYYADATITSTAVVDTPCPDDGSRTRWHRGPRHAIVRTDVVNQRPTEPPKMTNPRVIVSMGGVDEAGLTRKVASALSSLGTTIPIDVVIGWDSPHVEAVRREVRSSPCMELHVQPDNLVDLLAAATVAVLGVGNVVDEALTLGKAVVGYPLTEYHALRAQELADLGAMTFVQEDATEAVISSVTQQVIEDREFRNSLAVTAWNLFDGRGAERAVAVCQDLLRKRHQLAASQ